MPVGGSARVRADDVTSLYDESVELTLSSGHRVRAIVRTDPRQSNRPKCLLLHGNPGSLVDWERVLPRITAICDAAVVDMPGFGRSSPPTLVPAGLSLNRMAEDAIAVADSLGWSEPIFLAGHSHGGGVAQTVAANVPARVAGIVLLGTLGSPAHASYRLLSLLGASSATQLAGWLFRRRVLRALNRKILRGFMSDVFSPEQVTAAKADRELAIFCARPEILLSMVHVSLGQPCEQLLGSASRIRCPVLCVA